MAGSAKIIMGAVQGITALACGILTIIPAVITRDSSTLKYSWTHIKHGIGNVVAGTFEAIPLVQTALYGIRGLKTLQGSGLQVYIYTGQEGKFMPYASIVKRDWKISRDNDLVNTVKTMLNEKLQRNGGAQNVSQKRQLQFAQRALHKVYPHN